MIRKWTGIWLLLAFMAGTALFYTSQDVQHIESDIARMTAEIAKEQGSVRVLSAEWSYLNQPERLEKLVRENLPALVPVSGQRVVDVAGLEKVLADEEGLEQAPKIVKSFPQTAAPAPVVKTVSVPAKTDMTPALRKETASSSLIYVSDRLAVKKAAPAARNMAQVPAPAIKKQEKSFSDLMQSLGAR